MAGGQKGGFAEQSRQDFSEDLLVERKGVPEVAWAGGLRGRSFRESARDKPSELAPPRLLTLPSKPTVPPGHGL